MPVDRFRAKAISKLSAPGHGGGRFQRLRGSIGRSVVMASRDSERQSVGLLARCAQGQAQGPFDSGHGQTAGNTQ